MAKSKIIIGRVEMIDLPELNLFQIEAKIDSGAYSCSLHCHDIIEDKENNILYFKILDPKHLNYNDQELKFSSYSKVKVKSSNGVARIRYKIKTTIRIAKKNYKTSFTLTDRSKMRFPILLGRKVLSNRFLIDVALKNILTE